MAIPLVATKLHIPRPRPELVARPRLNERLSAGLDRQLVLVSTPAGFGKTTLLASWAERCGAALAWLALDEGDNDPVRFLAHLLAGFETVDDCLGAEGLAALQSAQPPPLEELLVGLINQLSAFPANCVLVLDDYHLIQSAAVHSLVAFLLEHQPPALHLVIASRADPPLPLARLRAAGQLVELRLKDLRFTSAEAAEFLGRVVGPALTAGSAERLTARTEGWIAGLQMAAVSLQGRDAHTIDRVIGAFTGHSHFVLDYLAEEVLQRQPPHIQSFLLRTSILDRLCGPLCDTVLGQEASGPDTPSPSQEILGQLEHANLFLIPLDDEQRWYRYHQLFADLLRHRLQQTEPALRRALCQRASRWHEHNGLLADAVNYALAARDHERALRLVELAAEPALMHSEGATFLGWLEQLPAALVQTRPALCIYQAWARLVDGESLDTIDAIVPALRASGPQAEMTAPLRAFIALFRGDMALAVSLSREALAQLPESESFLRGLAALTVGLAYLTDGDMASAQLALDQAAQIGQKTGNLMVSVVVLCSLGEQCRKQGQLHQAFSFFQQALERATGERGRRWPVAGRALISLGDLLREWNDLEPAEKYLLEGIELANRWGQVWALSGYLALARLWQAQGKADEARQAMHQAVQRVRQDNFSRLSRVGVEMAQAWLWVNQGNLAAARRWAEQRDVAQAVDPSELDQRQDFVKYHLRKYEYPVLARLWLAEGRAGEALAMLERAEPKVGKQQRPGLVIEYNLLKAEALAAMGQTGRALPALERALVLAEPENYVRLMADEGEPIRRLLLELRPSLTGRHNRLNDYVEKLLAAFGRAAPAQPPSPRPELEPPRLLLGAEALSARELEVLRLLATSLSAAEVADELSVAVSTVRSHTKSIYAKLGVNRRLEALQRARDLGWL